MSGTNLTIATTLCSKRNDKQTQSFMQTCSYHQNGAGTNVPSQLSSLLQPIPDGRKGSATVGNSKERPNLCNSGEHRSSQQRQEVSTMPTRLPNRRKEESVAPRTITLRSASANAVMDSKVVPQFPAHRVPIDNRLLANP